MRKLFNIKCMQQILIPKSNSGGAWILIWSLLTYIYMLVIILIHGLSYNTKQHTITL